jgi:peroxiredoxin (alkyl hydroperoxide reductase subunit C)
MSPIIQSPAPAFTVTALVDGEFKQVSLSDYVGQWFVLFLDGPLLLTRRHLG